jgi:predicted DNA-binding transcriptional regulator AlpA
MSEAQNNETVYLNANQVRRRFAGCSHMAILRWIEREGFPQPVYFGRKRFWLESALQEWERAQAVKTKSRPPTGFQRTKKNAA